MVKPSQTRVPENSRAVARPVKWLLLVLMLSPPIQAVSAESAPADLDPVVAEILEMLDAGVDEGVILQWLESTDRRPVDIGSQGLIALAEVEASEEFVKILLTLVENEGTDESDRASPPLAATPRAVESAPLAGRPGEQGSVDATIRLRAKRVWVDEDEPDRPRDPPWSIFLYLDSQLVSWAWPTRQGEPVEVHRRIQAGRHEMRVVLQRYEELRSGWSYESLSVPTLIDFETQGGVPLEIDVAMTRIWGLWRQRRDGGPLSFVIRSGDQVLAENDGTGGDPNRWRPVCEDVEANFPDSETVPKRFRSSMGRCIRWTELWTGAGQETSREDILRSLAEDEFQPPVR